MCVRKKERERAHVLACLRLDDDGEVPELLVFLYLLGGSLVTPGSYLGSVASYVASHCDCNVHICKSYK